MRVQIAETETSSYSASGVAGRSGDVVFHAARLDEMTAGRIDRWGKLEHAAIEPCAFLSPRFLYPAWRLHGGEPPLIVWGEDADGRIVGLGAFEECAGSRRLPCRHLRSWRCQHTFLDGFLVARGMDGTVLPAFWDFATQRGWSAVELEASPVESPLFQRMDQAAIERGAAVASGAIWRRPVCLPSLAGTAPPSSLMSSRRAKSLRSGWRFLERHGAPQVRIHSSADGTEARLRTLMRLEALGWKGKAGTALAANRDQQQFGVSMVQEFAGTGDAVFVDLAIDERVIASLLVLRSGDAGFAFKLGWDPRFERGCPGYQLLASLQTTSMEGIGELASIDSCASPGSFIESVWPTRRPFAARVYALSRKARTLLTLRGGARWARDLLTQ
jgi:CelD/BcsL family acetyltransferase involved in cellulose biosynthesis